ncbi:unnamed protein product [Caenorhabditis auriculariae]|uniref:Uncharacterized protein n=1 Tax=Caenorhabditis auriculariae TaxID=2777116 RepID=A0A8S1GSQ8_9PELO|nr:unnamed protein product [Caenorhabditis auriculariae]
MKVRERRLKVGTDQLECSPELGVDQSNGAEAHVKRFAKSERLPRASRSLGELVLIKPTKRTGLNRSTRKNDWERLSGSGGLCSSSAVCMCVCVCAVSRRLVELLGCGVRRRGRQDWFHQASSSPSVPSSA